MDGYYINNDDDPITFNLPAAEDGLKVSFGNIAYNQSIKVQPNNGDVIILNDGSSVSDPGWVYSSGALDDKGTFVAIDGNAWILWDEQNIWALVTGT